MADSLNPLDTNSLSTDLLSGSINFTGLGSGTDFNTIIDQLVELESIHKTRMEVWRSTWEAKIQAIEALNLRLEAVEEAAGAMDTEAEFLVRSAATSDSSIATASASSSATTGAYSIEVASSAKHILNSQGVADADTTSLAAANNTLQLTIDGTTYDIAITAGDTLNDIRDAINLSAAPVTASVSNDGTDSNPYHLEIISDTGGDAGRVSVTQNGTSLNLNTSGVVLQSNSWTGTATIDIVGQFTGDKAATADADIWTYTITNNTGSAQTVGGASPFDLEYTATDTASGTITSGAITVPADYVAGDSITLENGLSVQLGAGTINNGESVVYKAYANDIDDAEEVDWSGPAITTSGNYLGTVSKTYTFTVVTAASIQDGGGAGTAVLRWTDSTGGTGTVSVTDSTEAYSVDSGLKINIAAGSLNEGEDFQVNVFAPDKQQGQDTGLAQVARVVHSGFADSSKTSVTSTLSTLSYTYGGTEVSLSVPTGTTLTQLASLINDDTDNPGVSASILDDGQGLPTSFRLVLTGEGTGAKNQITNISHDLDNFNDGGGLGGGFTTSQLATNSMVKVDGFPSDPDEYLQRATNSLGDVIDGVSVDLHDAGAANITISHDVSAIVGKVQAFVNAVNYAQDFIRLNTKFDPSGEQNGILIGNYGFQILKTRTDSILYTPVSGLDSDVDTFTLLAQIGIESDPDDEGNWKVDTGTLRAALAKDAESVANLFVENSVRGTSGVAKNMKTEMAAQTDSETGMPSVLINNYNEIIDNINARIEKEENRIELYRQRQVERFARLEAMMAELNAMQTSLESQIEQLPEVKT